MVEGLDPVVEEFIADTRPYVDAVKNAASEARDFATANIEASSALDDLFRHSDEVIAAQREMAAQTGDARDALLEEAGAARIDADELGKLRDAAAEAAVATAAVDAAAGSGGLLATLSALGPELIAVAVALGAVGAAALFPVLAVLPLIAIGFAGLAAVAVPEITKVWQAVSAGGKAWRALTPEQKAAGRELRDLHAEFAGLARSVQPEILRGFDEALKILKDLMPAVGPLIREAGRALDIFLGQIDSWLKSGSGQKFVAWMKTDGVGAIKAFGEFLWGLVNVLGRTFSFLFNFGETVHRVFDRVRHDVAHWADEFAHGFDVARHTIASWGHDIAHDFDAVRGAVHGFFTYIGAHLAPFTQFWRSHWHEIEAIAKVAWKIIEVIAVAAWKTIVQVVHAGWALIGPFLKVALTGLENTWRVAWVIIRDVVKTAWQVITEIISGAVHLILNTIAIALDLLTGHWRQAWADAKKLTSDGLHAIISIIVSLTSGFGHLLWDAGVALIQGLIGGIKSMFGALGSVVGSIAGFISHLKGPLDYDRVLLVPHGQAIMHGLMHGIGSQLPALARQMAGVTGMVGAGGYGAGVPALAAAGGAAGPAGGGGVTWTGDVHVHGSTLASKQEVYGLVQQAFLDMWTRTRGTGVVPYGFGVH